MTETTFLDVERIATSPCKDEPWQYGRVDDYFTSPELGTRLAQSFPAEGFKHVRQTSTGKDFAVEVRDDITGPDLAAAWRAFLAELQGEAYLHATEKVTGISLGDCSRTVTLWRYGPDMHLDPHTDEGKVATHVMYFNETWSPDDGGNLLILGSNDLKDIRDTISPRLGSSVFICRSPSSWHAVQRLATGREVSRRSVTVVYRRR